MSQRLRQFTRQLWYLIPVGIVYALIGFYADRWALDRRAEQPQLPQAPEFRLPLIEPEVTPSTAKQVSLSELRGGPIVLNFWASWCTVCMDEKPYLDAIW